MITELDPHPDAVVPEPFAGPDHPIRKLTRSVALGEPWTADDAARMATAFDALAPQWSEDHVDPVKAAPVLDAIERGHPGLDGRWIELGSGTGAGSRVLHGKAREHVSVDVSEQMLAHAPDGITSKVRADSANLPFRSDAADVVLLINMLLFPEEVDRILAAGGAVVWVNTLGDQTPIHLPAHDVADALPGDWTGVTARAGSGFWAVFRRG
jgi:predicted TPR repeat methyltransferase